MRHSRRRTPCCNCTHSQVHPHRVAVLSRTVILAVILTAMAYMADAFAPSGVSVHHMQTRLYAADDISASLERAKALIDKSKEKLAAKEANGSAQPELIGVMEANGQSVKTASQPRNVPFFATLQAPSSKRKREAVVKTINDETGLITTDGEKMASLSEQEEWESRSLFEVFENEIEDKDVYSVASQQLAERDVAASIWNLRKTMQTEDYQRIFDKKNRFIGEDT